jgi:Fic family protein
MNKPAKQPAKIMATDRGEASSLMEPLLVREGTRPWKKLADLAVDLAAKSSGFQRSLPPTIANALARLVRSMNCYYSNLIEGHDTHPIDIERALKADFSSNPEQRDLQLEAQSHIEVQAWIDAGHFDKRATTVNGIVELHRRFCEKLPPSLLWVYNSQTGEKMPVMPGVLRDCDVKVGYHIAISPGAVPRFLQRFEEGYANLGKVDAIIAAATAHHRLLWVHPFLDGNGRVARLTSYAMLRDALNTGGLWSIARGLARQDQAYKKHLANADLSRRNDLDGRGTLSEEALADFAEFFLEICIDQVAFMETLMQPNRLRHRMQVWAEEEMRANILPQKSSLVLDALLYRGELARGEVETVLGVSERTARRVTSILLEQGVLQTASPRAPLQLAFPAKLAARWLPGLFPESSDQI